MEEWLKQLVLARADDKCEYCLRPSWSATAPFLTDHVRPRQHGGTTGPGNLALACPACNQKKGTNLYAVDPLTDAEVPVFNPRQHRWREHFSWTGNYDRRADRDRTRDCSPARPELEVTAAAPRRKSPGLARHLSTA